MRMGGALFVSGIFMRLPPDSACIKNPIANMIVSQQIRRAPAFDRFISRLDISRNLAQNSERTVVVLSLPVFDSMVLLLLLCASVAIFFLHRHRTVPDALRFGVMAIMPRCFEETQAKSLRENAPSHEKGNSAVTFAAR
jgi:hypothetical protein